MARAAKRSRKTARCLKRPGWPGGSSRVARLFKARLAHTRARALGREAASGRVRFFEGSVDLLILQPTSAPLVAAGKPPSLAIISHGRGRGTVAQITTSLRFARVPRSRFPCRKFLRGIPGVLVCLNEDVCLERVFITRKCCHGARVAGEIINSWWDADNIVSVSFLRVEIVLLAKGAVCLNVGGCVWRRIWGIDFVERFWN